MKSRWQIEDNFRTMKFTLETRPIYCRTKSHINAHILICFVALLLVKYLEKELEKKYTVNEIIDQLKLMQLAKVSDHFTATYTKTALLSDLENKYNLGLIKQHYNKDSFKKLINNTKK